MRDYQKSDFPLSPVDCKGQKLVVGDEVRIIEIPDIRFHGFDAIARARYAALHGKIMRISEFDESGYAVFALWYAATDEVEGRADEPTNVSRLEWHGFCFDPRDLERM